MPQASSLDRHLSRAEQHKLAAFLDENPHMTVDDFHAELERLGVAVGRSTAHREKRRLAKMGERLRRSQDLMEGIGESLQGKSDANRMRALVEANRTLLFELQEAMLDGEEDARNPQQMMFLTSALKGTMEAAQKVQQFGEAERRQTLEAASQRAGAAARKAGASTDLVAALRAAIEGSGEDE